MSSPQQDEIAALDKATTAKRDAIKQREQEATLTIVEDRILRGARAAQAMAEGRPGVCGAAGQARGRGRSLEGRSHQLLGSAQPTTAVGHHPPPPPPPLRRLAPASAPAPALCTRQ